MAKKSKIKREKDLENWILEQFERYVRIHKEHENVENV